MIKWDFIFIDECGMERTDKSFWADTEAEAMKMADEWGYANGYEDFRLVD